MAGTCAPPRLAGRQGLEGDQNGYHTVRKPASWVTTTEEYRIASLARVAQDAVRAVAPSGVLNQL